MTPSAGDLSRYRGGYESHLWRDVLPWWLTNAVDEEYGGVFTFWNTDGTVLHSDDKYSWSQGRWIWTMTACARLARSSSGATVEADRLLALAKQSAQFLWSHGMLGDGRVANFLTREGTPTAGFTGEDVYASVFADLFAALGFAGLGQCTELSDREAWATRAETILDRASERIEIGEALTAPYPVPARYEAFAPHMILINTATGVYRATDSDRSREILRRALHVTLTRFVDGDDLSELVGPHEESASTLYARHRNPGHTLEALWFIRDAADAVPAVAEELEQLLEEPLDRWLVDAALLAIERGWDRELGGILRFVDAQGGPPRGEHEASQYWQTVTRTWDYKLWWPHTEALYTLLLLYTRTGDRRIWRWFERVHEYTFDRFPAGPGNEWMQILSRDGARLETDAASALPVKDPFHLIRSLVLLATSPDQGQERAPLSRTKAPTRQGAAQ